MTNTQPTTKGETMTSQLPPLISQAWIDDAERNLVLQAPGELKDKKIEEIEEAKEHRAFWDKVDEFMRASESARVNLYPVKLGGGKKAEPFTVFYSKTQNKVWSFEQAVKLSQGGSAAKESLRLF